MPTKPWEEIKAKADPETIERAARKTESMLAALELNELRRARGISQEELANRLGMRQPNISKLERRIDVRVSSLRAVIEAMGGELRIIAHFPDADYEIDQFERAAEAAD